MTRRFVFIVSDSYVVRMAEMGSDVWSVMDINDAPLTVTTDTRDTQFVVIYTRTNAEGVFEIEYKVTGGQLKATATFTNNQYTNHKFAFTETIILADNLIELNEQTIDLNQFHIVYHLIDHRLKPLYYHHLHGMPKFDP